MLTMITLSPVFLLKAVRSFVVRPLPLHSAIHILILFLMSYGEWLIPHPAFSLSGSCRHTTSTIHSTIVSSTAMAHTYDLAELYWIGFNTGGGSNLRSVFRFDADPRSHRSFCRGWYWHCRCCWHLTLHLCDVLCLRSPFLCIGHLLFPLTTLSSFRCPSPEAECCPVCSWGWSHGHCGPSCWFPSPPLPCLPGGLPLFCAPAAECDVVFFAVRALLLCVATERALLCTAPHEVAFMGAGAEWPWAVAACLFAAALALYVAPPSVMLTSAVWADIREWFDSVPHSRHLDAFFDQIPRHLVPH